MSDEFDGQDATETAGIGAALNRCRALATKIGNELRNKRPEHFVDKSTLAEVHDALERAESDYEPGGSKQPSRPAFPSRCPFLLPQQMKAETNSKTFGQRC